MTHEEIKILISAYTDGEVTPSEKNIVEEHLSTCESCQKDFKAYKAMSSSLSQWSDENLSPDEEINVQKRFEQRREPMFTKRSLMVLGTTLALTIIVGSVVQLEFKKGMQGRLKSASDDIGDQYSDGHTLQSGYPRAASAPSYMTASTQYQPYYMQARLKSAGEVTSAQFADKDSGFGLGSMRMASNSMAMPMVRASIAKYETRRFARGLVMEDSALVPGYVPPTPLNHESKVIKNADLTIKVKNAQDAQSSLEDIVTKFNGIINVLNVNKLEDGSKRGVLVFSVFPKDFDHVLHELRKLGEVVSEYQSGSDITNQYTYLQTQLDNYKGVKQHLENVLKRNMNNVDDNLNIQGQISNIENIMASLEANMKNLDLRSYMSSITVNFYDTVEAVHPKEITFKDRIISTFKESLQASLETSYNIAISSFSGIVVVLTFMSQVLLWALLFWGIYLLISRFFKK